MASTTTTHHPHEGDDGGDDDDDRMARDPALVPVTYYPVGAQRAHARMRARVAGRPYARYFRGAPLYVRRAALAAAAAGPIRDPVAGALPLARARRLLAPGDQPVEDGWCALPDGAGYVASRTQFPGCTADMVDWWFWWHSVEGERYALWHPYSHRDVRSSYARAGRRRWWWWRWWWWGGGTGDAARPPLERDDLPHRQRWLGSTHTVREHIGPSHMKIRIEFKEPSYFGLGTWEELREAGYETAVCGVLWDGVLPLKVGDMIHLWRRNEGGLELKSRYYLGHQVYLRVLGFEVSVDRIGGWLGIKRLLAGERVAYEQFLHDQTEFTNLASFLPEIYREFGHQEGQGVPSDRRRKTSS